MFEKFKNMLGGSEAEANLREVMNREQKEPTKAESEAKMAQIMAKQLRKTEEEESQFDRESDARKAWEQGEIEKVIRGIYHPNEVGPTQPTLESKDRGGH